MRPGRESCSERRQAYGTVQQQRPRRIGPRLICGSFENGPRAGVRTAAPRPRISVVAARRHGPASANRSARLRRARARAPARVGTGLPSTVRAPPCSRVRTHADTRASTRCEARPADGAATRAVRLPETWAHGRGAGAPARGGWPDRAISGPYPAILVAFVQHRDPNSPAEGLGGAIALDRRRGARQTFSRDGGSSVAARWRRFGTGGGSQGKRDSFRVSTSSRGETPGPPGSRNFGGHQ